VARNLNDNPGVRAAVSLLTLAFFGPVAAGCISNEYTIPHDELRRLVMTPPEMRGQQVHVVQDLGSRRTDAIATDGPRWPEADPWPQPAYQEPPPEETRDTDLELQLDGHVDIQLDGPGGSRGYRPNGVAQSAWRGAPTGGGTPSGSWRGSPPSGGSITGWRGTPTGGGGGWHGVPPGSGSSGSSSGSGLGSLGSSSGGGGGNGGDAMIVLAVVLAAIAVVVAMALVSSEGVRFDGIAQMSPW
jgi:hypothetical protein